MICPLGVGSSFDFVDSTFYLFGGRLGFSVSVAGSSSFMRVIDGVGSDFARVVFPRLRNITCEIIDEGEKEKVHRTKRIEKAGKVPILSWTFVLFTEKSKHFSLRRNM